MRTLEHYFDLCVVGGGMAGMCTAISAARHGIKTALVQDRPVLGGNASSEIRMHICGEKKKNRRETGIIEEILLENYHRNTGLNYYIWDSVLYEKAYFQEIVHGITLQGTDRIGGLCGFYLAVQLERGGASQHVSKCLHAGD